MSFFQIDPEVERLSELALSDAKAQFDALDAITEYNQQKVLHAFISNGVSESHFGESTGYGYGDRGREVLDAVFAELEAEGRATLERAGVAPATMTFAPSMDLRHVGQGAAGG